MPKYLIGKRGVINWQKGYSFKINMHHNADKETDEFLEKIIEMFKKQFDLKDVNNNLKMGHNEANRKCNRRNSLKRYYKRKEVKEC